MKKILIGTVIVAVVLAAFLLVAPGLVGKRAEDALRASLDVIEQAGVYKVTVTSYDRGWFSSTASTTIEPLGQLAETYDMVMAEFDLPPGSRVWKLEHRLTHGPLLLTGSSPGFGLAQARTEVSPPNELQRMLAEYLSGSPLFTVDTRYGLSGGSSTELSNPPHMAKLGDSDMIRWDGVAAKVILDQDRIRYDLQSPMLRAETDAGLTVIDGIRLEGEQTRQGENLWLGDFSLTIPEIRLPTAQGNDVKISDASYRVSLALDTADQVDITAEYRVGGGEIADAKLGESAWGFELNNLPVQAFDDFIGTYTSTMQTLSEQQYLPGPTINTLSDAVVSLFTGPVELNLNTTIDLDVPDLMVLRGDNTISVAGENGVMHVDIRQMLNEFDVRDQETGDRTMALSDTVSDLSLTGLNGHALTGMVRDMVNAATAGLPPDQQAQRLGMAYALNLPLLVTPDTRLNLKNLTLNVPQGSASATGSIGIEGDEPLNLLMPATLVSRLDGSLSAKASEGAVFWAVSRNTLDAIRASLEETGRTVTEADVEQLAQTAARGRVNGLLAQALIRREGEHFVVDATLQNGMLILNGVPRPDLLGGQ